MDQCKEIFITFYSQKLWRPMRTCWKACRVCFPVPQVSSHLDIAIKSYQKVNILSWQNIGTTCREKLYQSTMFHGACHTLLESTRSLVSHPRNSSSFGLPNKKLWSVYWKLLWRPTVMWSQFGNPFRGVLSHCLPLETLFHFHPYLGGLFLV